MTEGSAIPTKRRSWLRLSLLAVVFMVVAAGAIAPLLNANRFRGEIHSALERALNRHVTIGKVHFNVFTGPGFTVEDVSIEDGPGMGIEPFAHVESLEARVRLTSLWTGHLAFSKLKLVEPSVNFVKADSGPWNVTPLLGRAAVVNTGMHASMPDIQISGGRLNFKFGNTKSVFYVSNADLEVYPDENDDLVIRFEGEPARTDHAAQGLGHLVARGVLRSKRKSEDELNLSVQLERTAVTELTRLFDLQDIGVRAYIASNLKLDGPLSRINVSGDLRIEDIHRWDLMPNKGEGWTLNYTGFLDLSAQQIDIETRAADPQGSPVTGRFVASNYLSSPKWQAALSFHDLPAAALLDTARHMGALIPAGSKLDAALNGEIAYSRGEGFQGQLVMNQGSFQLPQGAPTEFGFAPLAIQNNDVHFGPTEIRFDGDQAARLEMSYSLSTRALSLGLSTKELGLAETKALIARWLGADSLPLLEQCRLGSWQGALAFDRKDDAPGVWTGELELVATQMDLPGIAAPLRITAAAVQLSPEQVQLSRLRGHVGTVAIEGDYRYVTTGVRPDRLHLSIAEAQIVNLERLLLPTLSRQQGFLARALRLDQKVLPEWLKQRHLEGTVQVQSLLAGETNLGSAKAILIWDGAAVQLNNVEFHHDDTEGTAMIAVNLSGWIPRYRVAGQFSGIDYRNGRLDLDGSLETSGLDTDLALNARAEGTFTAQNFLLAPDSTVDEASGEFRLDSVSVGPRLILSKVQLTQGQDVLRGQGVSQGDGRLVLELTSGPKKVRMTGMLLPVHPVTEP